MKRIPLIPDHKYTMFSFDAPALTSRKEILLESVRDKPEFRRSHTGAVAIYRLGTYWFSRVRTPFQLDVDLHRTLILPGWDHGIPCIPGLRRAFAVSATVNFVPSPEAIHNIISKNLNPHFQRYDLIARCPEQAAS